MTLNKSRVFITAGVLVGMLLASSTLFSYSVFEQRFKQLMKKAESGNKRAQYKVGVSYMRGTSINFDKQKALLWLKKAAAKGYVKAWYRLGQMHYDPKYGLKNYSLAFKWFAKAARKGHGGSQYYMALLYHKGKGVHKDIDYALVWANRARKNGVSEATRLLAVLNGKNNSTRSTRKQVRSSSPKPRKGRKTRHADVASPGKLDVRHQLVAGGWNEGDSPSDFVPSHSNKCENVNGKIRCTSKRLKETRPEYTADYKIVSLITNFNSKGSFTIKYRRNFIFVLPDDPDDPNPKVALPSTGLEDKVSVLECKMLAKSRIRCYKEDKSVVRFTKK